MLIHQFPSGHKLYFQRTPGFASFFVSVGLSVGSVDDTIPGLAHFAEHMIFQGNARLGRPEEIFLKLDQLASEINAATSHYTTSFWIEGALSVWRDNVAILVQLLLEPSFEQLAKEKSVIRQEILAERNSNGQLISADDLLLSLLWPGQTLGQPIFGHPSSIQKIRRQDLLGFHQKHYNHFHFAITADLTDEEVVQCLEKILPPSPLGGQPIRPKNTILTPNLTHQALVQIDSAQVTVEWGFYANNLTEQERVWIEILADLLELGFSSYLVRHLRERLGLVYDISTSTFFHFDQGILSIRGETSEKLASLYQHKLDELLADLRAKNFTDEDFSILRKKKQLSLKVWQEVPRLFIAQRLEEAISLAGATISLDKYLFELERLDTQVFHRFVQKFLRMDRCVQVIVGPRLSLKALRTWPLKQST